jgi:hypothetical protein
MRRRPTTASLSAADPAGRSALVASVRGADDTNVSQFKPITPGRIVPWNTSCVMSFKLLSLLTEFSAPVSEHWFSLAMCRIARAVVAVAGYTLSRVRSIINRRTAMSFAARLFSMIAERRAAGTRIVSSLAAALETVSLMVVPLDRESVHVGRWAFGNMDLANPFRRRERIIDTLDAHELISLVGWFDRVYTRHSTGVLNIRAPERP